VGRARGQSSQKCRLAPPWNILVKNWEVNCAKFSNFDRFCSQNLLSLSAKCFSFGGPLPGLCPLTLLGQTPGLYPQMKIPGPATDAKVVLILLTVKCGYTYSRFIGYFPRLSTYLLVYLYVGCKSGCGGDLVSYTHCHGDVAIDNRKPHVYRQDAIITMVFCVYKRLS